MSASSLQASGFSLFHSMLHIQTSPWHSTFGIPGIIWFTFVRKIENLTQKLIGVLDEIQVFLVHFEVGSNKILGNLRPLSGNVLPCSLNEPVLNLQRNFFFKTQKEKPTFFSNTILKGPFQI